MQDVTEMFGMTIKGGCYIPTGFQQAYFMLKTMALWVPMVLGLLNTTPAAFAQEEEVEPNNTCLTAQPLELMAGSASLVVNGSLEPVSEPPSDVDFLLLTGEPGATLEVELRGEGAEALLTSNLGLFDGDCNLLDWNDNYYSLSSRLVVTVPADGTFILAVTGCCDAGFVGSHEYSGTYQL